MDYAANNYHVVRGFKFPLNFKRETIESGLDYEARPDDLFVVTYPKCGTTWTQQIVTLLLNDGEVCGSLDKISPFLELDGKEAAETGKRPLLIKSHFPSQLQPWHPMAKYLIVIRNPKDAMVSWYYHRMKIHGYFKVKDIHEFTRLWLAEEMAYDCYFDFYLSWLPRLSLPNVKLFIYEDMKMDTAKAVRQMAEFVGLKGKLEADNGRLLEQVLEKSTMAKMKEQFKESAFVSVVVRKGLVGDWKSELSAEDSELINQKFANKFKDTLFEHMWTAHVLN